MDRRERSRGMLELNQVLRARLASVAGVTVTEIGVPDGAGSTKAIQFALQGDDIDELRPALGRPRKQDARRFRASSISIRASSPTSRSSRST